MKKLFFLLFFIAIPALAADWTFQYGQVLGPILNSACFDPSIIRTNAAIGSRWGYYLWDHPRNYSQALTWDQTHNSSVTYESATALKCGYCTVTFGQWLSGVGKSVTGNPFLNGSLFNTYVQATLDHNALSAAELERERLDVKNSCINAGVPATDLRCNPTSTANVCYGWDSVALGSGTYPSGPTSRDCATVTRYMVGKADQRTYGPDSEAMMDVNGIYRAYYGTGYTDNDLNRLNSFNASASGQLVPMGGWTKPADCNVSIPPTATPAPPAPPSGLKCKNPTTGLCETPPVIFGGACPTGWIACGQVIPSPTQTPTVNPTPPIVNPALMCIDPNTGLCREYPRIFGNTCSAYGAVPCGATPTPAPPLMTPTPTSPPIFKTVACMSADGRYAYAAASCKADEVPLIKK